MGAKRVVYVTMVGDLFHRGHLELLNKARKLGECLIVGLHPDDVVERYKRKPVISFEDRKAIIAAIDGVEEVVEDCMDFREPKMLGNLKKFNVDVLVHGDDWLPPLYEKAREENLCDVVQVPCYPHITTTQLIEKIRGDKND